MHRLCPLVLAAALLLPAAARAQQPAAHPPHEKSVAAAGRHPRLFFAPEELEGLRKKVNAPGSWSRFLLDHARAMVARDFGADRTSGDHRFWAAVLAAPPGLAVLAESPEERAQMARTAIDFALSAIRELEPPYPNEPEWTARFLYRLIAITYDCCYDRMTESERGEFREEMQRICALVASGAVEASPGNHAIAFAVGLGLCALALDGDVPVEPRAIEDEIVVRGAVLPDGDFLTYRSSIEVQAAGSKAGAADFAPGKDYEVKWMRKADDAWQEGFGIHWIAGGKAPAKGQIFHVAYRFTPDLPRWQDRARLAVQRNLDHLWGDGASLAGVMYGSWTLHWMVDLCEAFRRCADVDFARHPAVRDAASWLLSELLHTDEPRVLRANNRNDSGYDQLDGLTRASPYLAWVMARCADDLEQRDAIAYFILKRSDRWLETASWREALWVNDGLRGSLPGWKEAPALGAPASRFFRGHDLANFRTGAWGGDSTDWSLFSLVAGPYSGMEHDQTDKGSFTFYALGEDFAIDCGYAQGDAKSDATEAHNYVLVDGQGQPGPWGTTGFVRSHFLSASIDAVHADLKRSWVNTNRWTAAEYRKPEAWPMRRADRYGLFFKFADRAPYALVVDTLDRDGAPHAWRWLLHTQEGNAVEAAGGTVRLAGKHGRGVLTAYPFWEGPPQVVQDTWEGHQFPVHPRIALEKKGIDPRFAVLLVPEKKGESAPLKIASEELGKVWAVKVERGPGADLILVNFARDDVGKNTFKIETDAAVAAVRLGPGGAIAAWLVEDGSVLKQDGRPLWQVFPKGVRGSACYDGAELAVAAPGATEFKAYAKELDKFTSGDETLAAGPAGEWIHWTARAKQMLQDACDGDGSAMRENFDNPVAPFWTLQPLNGASFSRVVDGEFCCAGVRHEWLSFTHRTFAPFRADVQQWPRTIFADSVLRGQFTIHEAKAGSVLRIGARVTDRTWPEWGPPDQDLIVLELDVDRGELRLAKRFDGKDEALASAKGPGLRDGKPHRYELSIQGAVIAAAIDGSKKISFTDKSGKLPVEGYFQWEIPEGMHVHWDEITVRTRP